MILKKFFHVNKQTNPPVRQQSQRLQVILGLFSSAITSQTYHVLYMPLAKFLPTSFALQIVGPRSRPSKVLICTCMWHCACPGGLRHFVGRLVLLAWRKSEFDSRKSTFRPRLLRKSDKQTPPTPIAGLGSFLYRWRHVRKGKNLCNSFKYRLDYFRSKV